MNTPERPTRHPRTITGLFKAHPDGFAFVNADDGEVTDVHIASRNQGGALDGDRVELTWRPGPRGRDGQVLRVLERGRTRLVGTLTGAHEFEVDDPRIRHRVRLRTARGRAAAHGIAPGVLVVGDIVRYPESPDDDLEVTLARVLGAPDDPRTEIEKLLIDHDVTEPFPAPVEKAAARIPGEVRPADHADRADLRHLPFATIDPETARDFDDAVALETLPGGIDRLWVAVADVSHYVRPGSPIDREAYQRACSIYLPDRAIPMLPEHLSAHLCSLVPEQDRLAMVARLDLDASGEVVASDFCAAVIHSRARLDYPGVAAALAGALRGERRARYAPWLDRLSRMVALAERLRARRMARGALDLDLPEAVVELDEDDPRRVRDVRRARKDPSERQAYGMIEEFMLAANEAVARSFTERREPTLWRIHAPPAAERLQPFLDLAESYGVRFDSDSLVTPRGLGQVLEQIKEHPAGKALSFQLLRSLKQASYDVKNVGHFGLAAPDYVHFTSPIRRYPDLVVHRLLKARLAALGKPAGGFAPLPEGGADMNELAEMARHTSARERRALEIDRAAIDVYRCTFMRDRLGDVLPGVISGVTSFGVFVQIDQPFIEGLVRVDTLPRDDYTFDDKTQRLVGARGGLVLALGAALSVEIASVSVRRRKIELRIAGELSYGAKPARPPRPAKLATSGRRRQDGGLRVSTRDAPGGRARAERRRGGRPGQARKASRKGGAGAQGKRKDRAARGSGKRRR